MKLIKKAIKGTMEFLRRRAEAKQLARKAVAKAQAQAAMTRTAVSQKAAFDDALARDAAYAALKAKRDKAKASKKKFLHYEADMRKRVIEILGETHQ